MKKNIFIFLVMIAAISTATHFSRAAAEEECEHQVVKGDNLWNLSGTYLKNPLQWPRIWKENPDIANPHLIYPNQEVRLPCPEKEIVIAEPPAPTPPAPTPAPLPPPEPIAPVAQAPPPTPKLDLGELKGPPGGPNSVLFAGDAGSMTMGTPIPLGIGAVMKKPHFDGKVIGQDNWKFAGAEEILTISLPGAVEGQRYGVYRDLGKVRHPAGGWRAWTSYGNLIMEMGVVEIVSTESESHTARVLEIFHDIDAGDYLGPVPDRPMLPPANEDKLYSDLTASVIAIHNMRAVASGRDIVYLDRGEKDGLAPGDELYVSKQKSRQAVVRVITVTPKTATAMVMPSTQQYIYPGDQLAINP